MALQVVQSGTQILATLQQRAGQARQACLASPMLHLLQSTTDLDAILPTLVRVWCTGAERLYVLGTGGSALGAHALIQMASTLPADDALCPVTIWEDMTLPVDSPNARYLLVSKSGRTLETMAQAYQLAQNLNVVGRVMVITDPVDNPLRRLATQEQWPIIEHPADIGGRFAVFSTVGMVPAYVAGLPVLHMRAAAREVDINLAVQSALDVLSLEAQGINSHVFWCYGARYAGVGGWYRQLWAESLGKNGGGSSLLPALGSIDQHSQLQLWREGPNDKSHTFLCDDISHYSATVPSIDDASMAYLAGHSVGHLLQTMRTATQDTLQHAQRPLRCIVPDSNAAPAQVMASLLMHLMMQTVAAGVLRDIDPYGQPAVEDGKQRALRMLQGGG